MTWYETLIVMGAIGVLSAFVGATFYCTNNRHHRACDRHIAEHPAAQELIKAERAGDMPAQLRAWQQLIRADYTADEIAQWARSQRTGK